MKPFTQRNPVPIGAITIVVVLIAVLVSYNINNLPFISGGTKYKADFSESAGLSGNDPVYVAGVEVGRVESVKLHDDRVRVEFTVDDAWIGDRSTASIQIRTLLGAKYLALDPQGEVKLKENGLIPLDRTAAPFDVVEAFNGLSRTLDETDTGQLAASLQTLADTFRGTPDEVQGALSGLSRLSETIASRDDELARLLSNTRGVSTVLADRNTEFQKLLEDGNLLLAEVQRRRDAIVSLLDGTRRLSTELRGLVAENTGQLRPALEQLDRVAAVLQRNSDQLNKGLELEAVFVRLFTNVVGNGRWFDAYVCGLAPPPIGPINPGGC